MKLSMEPQHNIFLFIRNKIGYLSSRSYVERWPVFYGWIIMIAGSLGLVMTSPGQTYTVSIFIEYFIEDLGLSRSLVSTLYSVGTLAGSLTLPLWGRQIDRRGSRKMVVLIAFLFGLSLLFMGYVQNAVMLGLGFIAIRMLGQGSLGLVSQTVINQWWVRKRGMIMGISGMIMAMLGMGAFPNLVHSLISLLGWRSTFPILAALLILGMVPIGFLLFRNQPEDYGMLPDDAPSPVNEEQRVESEERERASSWSLQEALRTPVFWILLASVASFTMIATGQFFHMVSIFDDQGLSSSAAASVFIPISLATALANLGGGVALDRIQVKYLLTAGLLFQAASLLMVQFLGSFASAIVFGVLLGTTSGLVRAVSAYVWPAYYGRIHLGSIYGFTTAAGVLGAALGPLPFGLARDLLGSYDPVLYGAAALSIVLAITGLTVRKPKKNGN